MRIVERVEIEQENWVDFRGVFKCHVVETFSPKVKKGQQINVVVVKQNIEEKTPDMFVHKNANIKLREGDEYRILVSEKLPKGWDKIKPEFDDLRIGLVALIAINSPGQDSDDD